MDIDLDNIWGDAKYYKWSRNEDDPKLAIYPTRMKDIVKFYDAVQCLLIPKNTFQNPQIIRMSYLAFLLEVSRLEENLPIFHKLTSLMQIVCRTENVKYGQDEKGKYYILIDDKSIIKESDFDKVKKIIGEQNLVEVENRSTGSELDKAKAEAREFLNKRNQKMADLEQQIVAYKCVSKVSYSEIKEMTIYQFRKELLTHDLIKSADLLQNAQYSGMVSFKDGTKIPHWLDALPDNSNSDDDVLMEKGKMDKLLADKGLVAK